MPCNWRNGNMVSNSTHYCMYIYVCRMYMCIISMHVGSTHYNALLDLTNKITLFLSPAHICSIKKELQVNNLHIHKTNNKILKIFMYLSFHGLYYF